MISHNVNIFDNLTHPLAPILRHKQFRAIATSGDPKELDLGERPIVIKDDARIAAGATVLHGVTVGRVAVVGAGSVVTCDVAPYTVVAGNPARVIRALDSSSGILDSVVNIDSPEQNSFHTKNCHSDDSQ